jgi:hypothetical protein
MPIRRYKPEQIVTLLRQIEVGIANGKTTPQGSRDHRADLLPLEKRVRQVEAESSQRP